MTPKTDSLIAKILFQLEIENAKLRVELEEIKTMDREQCCEYFKKQLCAELETANARIAELEAENMCDACGGTGKPESGLPCMCGGTGKMSDAALYLRKREVETFLKGRE